MVHSNSWSVSGAYQCDLEGYDCIVRHTSKSFREYTRNLFAEYSIFPTGMKYSLSFSGPWSRDSGYLLWVRTPSNTELGLDADERNHTLWPDCRMCLSLCSLSTYTSEYHKQRVSAWPTSFNSTAYLNVYLRDLHSAVRYDHRLAYDMASTLSESVSELAAATCCWQKYNQDHEKPPLS